LPGGRQRHRRPGRGLLDATDPRCRNALRRDTGDTRIGVVTVVAYPALMSNVRVGRPREERVDAALATAVRQLLIEFGYQKLTVDLIANRAGVGKPAIYRRYRSKAELIFGVVVHGRAR